MQVSILKLSELENEFTIGAEFYLPHYIEKVKKIRQKQDVRLLSEICILITDGDHSATQYTDEGILYLLSESIKEGYIDTTIKRYISPDLHVSLQRSQLKPGDVLLTKTGVYFGKSSVVPDNFPEANTSAHVGRFVVRKEIINPYYLSTFFNSEYGYSQLRRRGIKASRPEIKLVEFNDIKVVILNNEFQKKIEKISRDMLSVLVKSNSVFEETQTFLLSELGLLDWKPKYHLSFIKNYSDTQQVGRFDAEYFQPKYDEIVNVLVNEYNAKPIGDYDIFDITTGQYSDEYIEPNEGAPYIRGTDLINGSVDSDNLLYLPKKNQIEDKKAKEGDVVVTRVGTIGLSARIPKECEGATISDNLIRIRISDTEKINTYYLAAYLNSIIGKELMLRNGRGIVLQRLNQETLKEIVFPILPFNKQLSIAEKIIQSNNLRQQSKHLLECAKKAVEMAIEKDEETAMQWLESQVGSI
jgi:type I restriction enzyme S subunit